MTAIARSNRNEKSRVSKLCGSVILLLSCFLPGLVIGLFCFQIQAKAQENQAQNTSGVASPNKTKVESPAQGLNSIIDPSKITSPSNDRLPLPAFGKSNPLNTSLQFGAGGKNQDLSPLSSVAPTGIEISARNAEPAVKGLKALKVSVKNNTDRPIAFNGNETIATIGDAHFKAVPMSEISDRIQQPDNPKGYFARSMENTVTAALTVGTLQTVEGEMIRRGSIAGRYGFDNANRIDRLGRFSERILWPGDSSEGLVYFKTDKQLQGASIQLPVADFYDKKDSIIIPATVRQ